MNKIVVFGNSGAGKSTAAKKLCSVGGLAHLDLDTLAWQATRPPQRKPLGESRVEINSFIEQNDGWVIEGCYADLLELVIPFSSEIIFLNLPVEACIENAKKRPWEPHKYSSKDEQDGNLEMLIDWISSYSERADTFSEAAHKRLYKQYSGKKSMVTGNEPAA